MPGIVIPGIDMPGVAIPGIMPGPERPYGLLAIPGMVLEPMPPDGPPRFKEELASSGRRLTRLTSTGMVEFAHWVSSRGSRR